MPHSNHFNCTYFFKLLFFSRFKLSSPNFPREKKNSRPASFDFNFAQNFFQYSQRKELKKEFPDQRFPPNVIGGNDKCQGIRTGDKVPTPRVLWALPTEMLCLKTVVYTSIFHIFKPRLTLLENVSSTIACAEVGIDCGF